MTSTIPAVMDPTSWTGMSTCAAERLPATPRDAGWGRQCCSSAGSPHGCGRRRPFLSSFGGKAFGEPVVLGGGDPRWIWDWRSVLITPIHRMDDPGSCVRSRRCGVWRAATPGCCPAICPSCCCSPSISTGYDCGCLRNTSPTCGGKATPTCTPSSPNAATKKSLGPQTHSHR
jgi:hypothetical protein